MTAPAGSGLGLTLALLGAVAAGSCVGLAAPAVGEAASGLVDWTVLLLVLLLFLEMKIPRELPSRQDVRFLAVALLANFVAIPVIGFGVASLFLSGQPLFQVGLVIYFMAPCTDWFLGFTRLAGGNVRLGAVLLPLNMVAQLLLYPVYLRLFADLPGTVAPSLIGATLLQWLLAPLALAAALRLLVRPMLPAGMSSRLAAGLPMAVPGVLVALVAGIFAANVRTIADHAAVFPTVVFAVFTFFVMTFVLGEVLSRLARFAYPERALMTMTTAARNAPLMLGVTMVALPDRPLVYAALVIGMLVEFPHLTALRLILLHGKRAADVDGVPKRPAHSASLDTERGARP